MLRVDDEFTQLKCQKTYNGDEMYKNRKNKIMYKTKSFVKLEKAYHQQHHPQHSDENQDTVTFATQSSPAKEPPSLRPSMKTEEDGEVPVFHDPPRVRYNLTPHHHKMEYMTPKEKKNYLNSLTYTQRKEEMKLLKLMKQM